MKTNLFCGFILMSLLSLLQISCTKTDDIEIKDNVQISLDKTEMTLEIGKMQRLIAGFNPSDTENTAHTWQTSDPKVALVDETGMVKAVGVGKATITVVALSFKSSATCEVIVVDKLISPTSVSLNKTDENLLVGQSVKLEATVLPENSNDKSLTWSSSNNKVATVDNDGNVTASSTGTAEITVITTNNKAAKCRISVSDPSVEFSDLKIEVIDEKSAKVSFAVTSTGITLTEVGVCYDKEQTPTLDSSVLKLDAGKSNQSGIIDNLQPETSYFIRTYAQDKNNIYYGATTKFITQGVLKTDFKVRRISEDELILEISEIPGISELNICYGIAPHPEITDNVTASKRFGDGVFFILKNLKEACKYYFRAYQIKNGKATYFDKEGEASTMGVEGQKVIGKNLKESYNGMNYVLWEIKYDLPAGTYLLTATGYYGDVYFKFYKDKPNENSLSSEHTWNGEKFMYVSGGEGTIYVITSRKYKNPTYTLSFEELESGIIYQYYQDGYK